MAKQRAVMVNGGTSALARRRPAREPGDEDSPPPSRATSHRSCNGIVPRSSTWSRHAADRRDEDRGHDQLGTRPSSPQPRQLLTGARSARSPASTGCSYRRQLRRPRLTSALGTGTRRPALTSFARGTRSRPQQRRHDQVDDPEWFDQTLVRRGRVATAGGTCSAASRATTTASATGRWHAVRHGVPVRGHGYNERRSVPPYVACNSTVSPSSATAGQLRPPDGGRAARGHRGQPVRPPRSDELDAVPLPAPGRHRRSTMGVPARARHPVPHGLTATSCASGSPTSRLRRRKWAAQRDG